MLKTHIFEILGGVKRNGFPSINAPALYTDNGTPYLTEPGVVMLSKPKTDISGMRGFLQGFGEELGFGDYLEDRKMLSDGAQLCKTAGQLCYTSFGEKRTKNVDASGYFENILSSGHGSVIEHASFSFLLYGISRSVTHELVRHRAGTGFSQVSQRYVSGAVLRFVERPEYREDAGLHELFVGRIDRSQTEYEAMADMLLERQEGGAATLGAEHKRDARKRVQQTARSLLPNETEAPMVFTANIRALRHILEMRASEHAESEIRRLAIKLFACAAVAEPILFSDYEVERLPDGSYGISTEYGKV